jgi:diacylglycerol kinase family enzyme
MTVERGAAWGSAAPLPADGVVVRSDAEARAVVERARRSGAAVPPLGLLGGDLCRTLGGPGDEARLRSPEATTVPCDLGSALIDGRLHWFVAHAVLRRGWWRGRVVAVMNAQWRGPWDVAPRAHPGDGRLDVVDSDLGPGDRFKARARLPTGTHVPHPGIRTTTTAAQTFDLRPPLDVWLDGERVARAASVLVRVEPDALTVVI